MRLTTKFGSRLAAHACENLIFGSWWSPELHSPPFEIIGIKLNKTFKKSSKQYLVEIEGEKLLIK